MISRCQSEDTFVAFHPMEIFRFWRNGEFTFSKDVYSRSILLSPHPLPNKVFHIALMFSSLTITSAKFND